MNRFRSRYSAGEWVRVRPREEILRTLDEHGALGNLPFMPEMLKFCGQKFRVFASAHKTCDTVHYTGGRRMHSAVHLEGLRCDGSGHDGCQANCLLFWKEAWLEPYGPGASGGAQRVASPDDSSRNRHCDEQTLSRATCNRTEDPKSPTYSCQATCLFAATTALRPWNPRQYIADVRSGNESPIDAMKSLTLAFLYNLRRVGIGYRLACALYEKAHVLITGQASPYDRGKIDAGVPTPAEELGLNVGEYVEVKSHPEILRTLNERNRNRGLSFDKEMVRYCGQRFRVAARVRTIINETTGKMLHLSNSSVILEGTYCTSRYSERRLLCPRRITPYWREIWLRRSEDPVAAPSETAADVDR